MKSELYLDFPLLVWRNRMYVVSLLQK